MAKTAKTFVITAKMLEKKKACASQVALFRQTFGEQVEFKTLKAAKAAAGLTADKFDWDWAAKNFLSPAAMVKYAVVAVVAWTKYERVARAAREEYEKAARTALVKYAKVALAAREEYEKVRGETFAALAWKELAK